MRFVAMVASFIVFTFGFQYSNKPDRSLGFGRAWIAVPNRTAGEKFVNEFARSFHVRAPANARKRSLAPLHHGKFGLPAIRPPFGRALGQVARERDFVRCSLPSNIW
jgi:hypothetical protein